MTSLRDELSGRRTSPTPYSILCPPGWQRLPATVLTDEASSARALGAFRAAGRADLVLQFRAMLARLRASMAERGVFEVFLPPAVDDIPLPAVLTVSPFVKPKGVDWAEAATRLARSAEVEHAVDRTTPMWIVRRQEVVRDEAASLDSRRVMSIVPVPESDGAESDRALLFDYTVLVPPGDGADGLADTLLATGEIIMATMRWLPARSA